MLLGHAYRRKIITMRAIIVAIIVLALRLSMADVKISRVNHILAAELPPDVSYTDWPFLFDTKLTLRHDNVNTISSMYFNIILNAQKFKVTLYCTFSNNMNIQYKLDDNHPLC